MSELTSSDQNFNRADLARTCAQTLAVQPAQVMQAIELLDTGNTIPFIARYRKESTRGLDETALRAIENALAVAKELGQRKRTVLKAAQQQSKLTPTLREHIEAATTRAKLELIYSAFKPRKSSRADIARERGLDGLAQTFLQQRNLPEPAQRVVQKYIAPERDIADAASAIAGACDIVAQTWADDPSLRQWLCERAAKGQLVSAIKRGKRDEGSQFENYFDYSERVERIPSHRFLAIKRGEAASILRVSIELDDDHVLGQLRSRLLTNRNFAFATELRDALDDAYKRLLLPAATAVVLQDLKHAADRSAIEVFAKNMRELLMAPPAGAQVTLGVDPGFRSGCKLAVVDATGRFLSAETIYPTAPRNDITGAGRMLLGLVKKFAVTLVAIGNGTASRETQAFVRDALAEHLPSVMQVIVSEAGASVYSASELAITEYPQLDVTVRGAISIAHRLQDPLAELVKVEPKAVGVGQYQHDVNQPALKKSLEAVVESCVNTVGVDLNTSSAALLSHVAGIGPSLAARIVEYRDAQGPFTSRKDLLQVPKLGAKAFEQCAGFLRIRDGSEPLDNSAVHPESYAVVSKMAKHLGLSTRELVGNTQAVARIQVQDFVQEAAGDYTLRDIVAELGSPGRDPRQEFRVATFSDEINSVGDLVQGLRLEGVVTNVTHFGAFVDIGVHQDGLVHISQLADHFVKDPSDVVSVGDIVSVTVLDVDSKRKRISLSCKRTAGAHSAS